MPLECRRGIHIPQIFRILNTPHGTYIIIEYIQGIILCQYYQNIKGFEAVSKPCYDQIARGIKLLLLIPVPSDARPGPCSGGIIKHSFFKDFEAPTKYDLVKRLEEHINIIYSQC